MLKLLVTTTATCYIIHVRPQFTTCFEIPQLHLVACKRNGFARLSNKLPRARFCLIAAQQFNFLASNALAINSVIVMDGLLQDNSQQVFKTQWPHNRQNLSAKPLVALQTFSPDESNSGFTSCEFAESWVEHIFLTEIRDGLKLDENITHHTYTFICVSKFESLFRLSRIYDWQSRDFRIFFPSFSISKHSFHQQF